MKRTPFLVIAAAILTLALLASASARAQAPAGDVGEDDLSALTDRARELYDQGTKAAAAKQWTEAHAAFLAAWELKPHYPIAIHLAVAEAKLGKPRDAAEHAAFYLRETPADRKDGLRGRQDAKGCREARGRGGSHGHAAGRRDCAHGRLVNR